MDRKNEHIIVFLERNTFNVTFRKPAFAHQWIEFGETASDEVVDRLGQATIAICNKLPLRADALSQLPKLKLIAVAATPREGNSLLDVDLPNLIVTPHNAWASRQAMETLADQLIDNLEAFVKGEPRNLV